ncbi:MAG: PH domain-containing protein [Pirellulaceae bacterium]|nr:PH domain-containing protein [Pirellulaceae bacterium]MDP7016338.1 PH domain-containing protein [Pirellulaceae bacterium]
MSDESKPETPADRIRGAVGGGTDDETESDCWSGGYSGKDMIGSWALGLLATVGIGVVCFGFIPTGGPIAFAVIAGLIWVYLLGLLAYRKLSYHYELTTQRFIHKAGILRRTTDRIEVIDIDDVRFAQGIVQRMLGVGTVSISSSDRSHPELHMRGINDVQNVADLIDDVRRAERRRRGVHIEAI